MVNSSAFKINDKENYRNLASDNILEFPGSVFYHPDMLQIAAALLGLRYDPAVVTVGDEVVALNNTLYRHKASVRSASIPHLFQYFGPVILKRAEGLTKYLADYISSRYDTCVLCLTPEKSDSFDPVGWSDITRTTYYLKPDSFENMRQACEPGVKNKLNRAARENIEIRTVESFPWDIYQQTFTRKNVVPPLSESITCRWVEKLLQLGICRIFVAYCDNRQVAFRTQLIYNSYAYDWLAGALHQYSRLGANQLLILTIGELLFKQGIKSWDLLGGDIESIRQFKKSFGAAEQPHRQLEKSFSLKGKLYRRIMKLRAGDV